MAGRIPQKFIDELLDRVDVVDVIGSRVQLRRAGKNYSALCPFHDEKSPSFSVSPDKQFYYCFGCGAGGNALGFLMEYERIEFIPAVEKLAAIAGVEVPREGGEDPAAARQGELLRTLDSASQWFQRQLQEHSHRDEAIAYIRKRGITPETCAEFGIGYAPPGWDGLLRALGGSDDARRLLLDAGLEIKRDDGGLYDRFRQRLMFPIRDNRGRTVAFGGRVLTDEKPKYLNSPETSVFHKSQELYGLYEARRSQRDLDQALVVEGYMDVVMLAQHGIRNAVGTLGTALTSNHLQRLFRITPTVVFCFDGDEAGRRAAARALDLVLPTMLDGRQAGFLFLPEGEDPDSLVQRIGAEAFRAEVKRAMPLSDYLFQHFSQDIDLTQVDGRARLSKLMLPAIERVPGSVYKELLREQLARTVGLAVDRLPGAQASAPGEASNAGPREPAPQPARRPPNRSQSARVVQGSARAALRVLLQHPELGLQTGDLSALAGSPDPDQQLLLQVLEFFDENPDAGTGRLLGYWYGTEEGELLSRLAAQDLLPGTDVAREFHDTLAHLAQQTTRANADQERRELEATPFAQMSPEQKQRYLLLIAGPAR